MSSSSTGRAEDDMAATEQAPPTPVHAHTVLVVDDYPAVLAWATRAFQRAGWTVLTAVDAIEAHERWDAARVSSAPVTLLVTDLELPGVDGITLSRNLREQDPALALIAISAYDGRSESWRGPLLDRMAFFRKPVRAANLLATAAALVSNTDDRETETSPPEDL